MYNSESNQENETYKILWDFLYTNRSSNLGQTTRPSDSQQKNRTWRIVYFAVPADHRVKLNESEKRDKYLDLDRELKKKTMKVTVILIVISALGTITKGLVKGLKDLEIRIRVMIIQNTVLLKLAIVLRWILAVTQIPAEIH